MDSQYFDRLYKQNTIAGTPYFKRFYKHNVVVTRPGGDHGPNGYESGPSTEILDTRGDLQQSGKALEQYAAGYENATAVLYCEDDIVDVEPGDQVGIVADTRNVSAVVEAIMYDNNALLLDL